MRKSIPRNVGTSYRAKRIIGGAIGLGAIATALLMALSPIAAAGVAHPASFPGAVWSPTKSVYLSGCAAAKASTPHWSTVTGAGKWAGKAMAKTCPRSLGGSTAYSYASASGYLGVTVPVRFTSHTGGINVSWSLNMIATTAASIIGSTACPTVKTTYSYNYGTYWLNYTYLTQSCTATATVSVTAGAYLFDKTNGTYMFGNFWSGVYNNSGMYQYASWYWGNYSNTYTNFSGNYSYSTSYGTPGSASGLYVPQSFINATFLSSHRYAVIAYVSDYAGVAVTGYAHAVAKANLNLATAGNYENLNPFVIW